MRLGHQLGLSVLFLLFLSVAYAKSPVASTRQLIVVTTPNWDSVGGTLRRYERKNAKSPWVPVGPPITIVVGKSGLAWGRGPYPPPGSSAGPVKKEGDGRAPAGVFRIPELFGYAPKQEATGFHLPYVQATGTLECVDDVHSRYYNQLVDRSRVRKVDWKSSEEMHRSDELYRWGAVVAHNYPRAAKGGGSCIFLHISKTVEEGGQGTAGCTAMHEPSLLDVLRWLDARQKPLLVQLPEPDYQRLQQAWALPVR